MTHYIDCYSGLAEFNDDWLCCVIYMSQGSFDYEARSWLNIYPLELP